MIVKSWKDSKILQYQFKEEYPLAWVNKKGDVEIPALPTLKEMVQSIHPEFENNSMYVSMEAPF